jgi:hypothetical protein
MTSNSGRPTIATLFSGGEAGKQLFELLADKEGPKC